MEQRDRSQLLNTHSPGVAYLTSVNVTSPPGDLESQIEAFVENYNQRRYHESLNNLTPADVWFGRGQTVLLKR